MYILANTLNHISLGIASFHLSGYCIVVLRFSFQSNVICILATTSEGDEESKLWSEGDRKSDDERKRKDKKNGKVQ